MSAHFTPQGPYTTGGNFTAANANNIETGIGAVDNAKADLAGATFTGAITATAFHGNADSATSATNASNLVNGAHVASVNASGALVLPSGSTSIYTLGISGSGSATVSLSSGVTGGTAPFVALVNNTAGSSSSTMGSGSYTGTSVFIYQNAAMAWKGIAFA